MSDTIIYTRERELELRDIAKRAYVRRMQAQQEADIAWDEYIAYIKAREAAGGREGAE